MQYFGSSIIIIQLTDGDYGSKAMAQEILIVFSPSESREVVSGEWRCPICRFFSSHNEI